MKHLSKCDFVIAPIFEIAGGQREERTAGIDAIHIKSRKTEDGGGGILRDRYDGANVSSNEGDYEEMYIRQITGDMYCHRFM